MRWRKRHRRIVWEPGCYHQYTKKQKKARRKREESEKKARKDRERQERRIGKGLKKRRLWLRKAEWKKEESLSRKVEEEADAADLANNGKIRVIQEAREAEGGKRSVIEQRRRYCKTTRGGASSRAGTTRFAGQEVAEDYR